jgi:hypothetical protein
LKSFNFFDFWLVRYVPSVPYLRFAVTSTLKDRSPKQ